ncbi:hypothetical protein ACLOAV_010853 [Pseudogymnoascus australis]
MAMHGMHSRFRRETHPALAIRVPRYPEWDGPAEAAGGGELEAEIIVEACNGVIVLVDYEEVAAGCEVAVVEAVEGGEWEERGSGGRALRVWWPGEESSAELRGRCLSL